MAIIHEGSCCGICGERLDRPYTATSGCAFEPRHLLFRFCDAPMHLDCLAAWPHREQFSKGYYDGALQAYATRLGSVLHLAEDWFLACGPTVDANSPSVKYMGARPGEPVYAEVRLVRWPFRLYSKWAEWDEYVTRGYCEGLEGVALDAAVNAMSEVATICPSQSALSALLAARTPQR
ncbi:MAG TPA: hypothetical protein VGI10_05070 [Polyangiaceae bacterium]|jgi:hypothetical protein